MKRFIILTLSTLLCSSVANAEIIIFKDGTSIKGKIIEDGHYYIKVMESGSLPKQYYKEKIEEIMEDPELYEWNPDLINANGFEGISAKKVLLIIEHMEANGARFNVQRNMELMVEGAPEESKEKLKELLDIYEVMGELIPIYDQVYSEEELRELNSFLKTPTGSKMINAVPEIMKASVPVVTEYFKKRLGGKLEL